MSDQLVKKVKMTKGALKSAMKQAKDRGFTQEQIDNALFLTGRERKCTAKSGRTGKPCNKWAIKGGFVCSTHGGSAPQVKKAAARRMLDLVDPAISRLHELMMQNEHLPTSLAAASTVLNRGLGKVGDEAGNNSRTPTINIGFAVKVDEGKVSSATPHITLPALPPAQKVLDEASDDPFVEADIETDEDDDEPSGPDA